MTSIGDLRTINHFRGAWAYIRTCSDLCDSLDTVGFKVLMCTQSHHRIRSTYFVVVCSVDGANTRHLSSISRPLLLVDPCNHMGTEPPIPWLSAQVHYACWPMDFKWADGPHWSGWYGFRIFCRSLLQVKSPRPRETHSSLCAGHDHHRRHLFA
jgi:hypothetical protein